MFSKELRSLFTEYVDDYQQTRTPKVDRDPTSSPIKDDVAD
jgi:hypothetical protein